LEAYVPFAGSFFFNENLVVWELGKEGRVDKGQTARMCKL